MWDPCQQRVSNVNSYFQLCDTHIAHAFTQANYCDAIWLYVLDIRISFYFYILIESYLDLFHISVKSPSLVGVLES